MTLPSFTAGTSQSKRCTAVEQSALFLQLKPISVAFSLLRALGSSRPPSPALQSCSPCACADLFWKGLAKALVVYKPLLSSRHGMSFVCIDDRVKRSQLHAAALLNFSFSVCRDVDAAAAAASATLGRDPVSPMRPRAALNRGKSNSAGNAVPVTESAPWGTPARRPCQHTPCRQQQHNICFMRQRVRAQASAHVLCFVEVTPCCACYACINRWNAPNTVVVANEDPMMLTSYQV